MQKLNPKDYSLEGSRPESNPRRRTVTNSMGTVFGSPPVDHIFQHVTDVGLHTAAVPSRNMFAYLCFAWKEMPNYQIYSFYSQFLRSEIGVYVTLFSHFLFIFDDLLLIQCSGSTDSEGYAGFIRHQ